MTIMMIMKNPKVVIMMNQVRRLIFINKIKRKER